MLFLHLGCVLAFVSAALALVPSYSALHKRHNQLAARQATAAQPSSNFVVYLFDAVNTGTGFPSVAELQQFNVLVLSFLVTSGPIGQAAKWTQLSDAQRDSIKAAYNQAGIKLMISLFGDTDDVTTDNNDPVQTANNMADWVLQYKLDGVDVDYEDFNFIDAQPLTAVAWLVSFTKQLRARLPQGQFLLTHAPPAPWFSPMILDGPYLQIHQQAGNEIDFYNLQFYNQGDDEYTNCTALISDSGARFPGTALLQIAQTVPLSKLVLGKPATASGGTGYMHPAALEKCIQMAVEQGWYGGFMIWQLSLYHPGSKWISKIVSLFA